MKYQKYWTVIQCDHECKGADAIVSAYGLFTSEEEALDLLANIRDDDPEAGNGWTTVRILATWGRKS